MLTEFQAQQATSDKGKEMISLIEELYPICRSITGDGVRETLDIIGREIPLTVREVPSGTQVFDWRVPNEWNIRDAYIKNLNGERIVDFKASNLHVVSYSLPVKGRFSFDELKSHLFVHPENKEWIPYRTSYYTESWGFCLSQNQLDSMTDREYDVCIDSTLESGALTYAEFFKEGASTDEVLLSTHLCHPSMCNDNLSGISVLVHLAKLIADRKTKYSYRLIFIPSTIGAITWLASNEENVGRIKHGLVVSCVGDDGIFQYKKSRRGTARIDRVVEHVFSDSKHEYIINDFFPYGYDERQFCSPGFNLPMGRLTRSPNAGYPEYHSSADDLSLISGSALEQSLEMVVRVLELLEKERLYVNTNPWCEPQLGRRGIYDSVTGNISQAELAILWVLNLSDGNYSTIDISKASGMSAAEISTAVESLLDKGLLIEKEE